MPALNYPCCYDSNIIHQGYCLSTRLLAATLSSVLSFQRCIDLCTSYRRKKKGRRKEGGWEGASHGSQDPFKYDGGTVVVPPQPENLFSRNMLSCLGLLPSSREPHEGLNACKRIEMDFDNNAHSGTASCMSARKFSESITSPCTSPDSQVPTGEPFACRVSVTGESGAFIFLRRILFTFVRLWSHSRFGVNMFP